MSKIKDILEYWYAIEFFSPSEIKLNSNGVKIGRRQAGELPWKNDKEGNKEYNVYLGEVKSEVLLKEIHNKLELDDVGIEADSSNSCICGLKLNSKGCYIEKSFTVASFVWAISQILNKKSFDAVITEEEINRFNEDIDNLLVLNIDTFNFDGLINVLNQLIDKFNLNEVSIQQIIKINSDFKKNNDKEKTSTEMMNSFYLKDIMKIKNSINPNDKLAKYIDSLNIKNKNRVEIDINVEAMKKWLSPDKYPLGKWPSQHSPSLMQQIAINMAISNDETVGDVFSVNGPPGTGKTTLLKEVIASYIVDRAKELIRYSDPDKAFTKRDFRFPPNNYLKSYYKMENSISNYGIVVASNNNAAVENISKDLPKAMDVKKSLTELFDIEKNKEIFFTDLASKLMGEESWGLISARLGKGENINEFKNILWFDKEINLQDYYKNSEDKIDWDTARSNFEKKLSEVIEYRRKIEIAVNDVNSINELREKYIKKEQELRLVKENFKEIAILTSNINNEVDNINKAKENINKNIDIMNENLSFFKKLAPFLFKNDKSLIKINDLKNKLIQINIRLVDKNDELRKLEEEQRLIEIRLSSNELEYKDAREFYGEKNRELSKYKKQFKDNYADEKYYENIKENEKSQTQCPWTDSKYDILREELFHAALVLHKSFVLNSKSVKQNINCLINMWSNKFTQYDKEEAFSDIFNTLFLLVPVISTTFASVQSFLRNVKKESIGTLIIDEAGQATPQSAVGAMWRVKKSIVVGDPLQVEPVVTSSKELSKQYIKKLNINGLYLRPELSVQEMSDNISTYGGYRNGSWVGCPLIVHRRCVTPMFDISNEIAYEKRMFKQTYEGKLSEEILSLKNQWIDVSGKEVGNKNHFIKAEGDKAIELVLKAFNDYKGFPNIYIISPFTSVVNETKKLLKKCIKDKYDKYSEKEINEWVKKSCGTVHTFQGKEAKEVVLILGCDEITGKPAAAWASSKPNILNVAVTRAKYRIVIIGNSAVWGEVPNFNLAYKLLSK